MKRRGNLYAAILAGALSLFPVAAVPAEGTGRTAGTTAGASSATDNAAGTTAAGPAAEQAGKPRNGSATGRAGDGTDRTGIAAVSEAGAAEQSGTIRSGTESAAQKRPKSEPAVRDSLRRNDRSGGIAPPSFAPECDGKRPRRLTHRIGAEFRPEHIFTINPFLRGENLAQLPVDLSLAAHLKYSFRFRPGSPADRTYGGVYQGFGIAYYDFANPQELGNPVAAYLFQGARIARLSRRLSLDYEWNFGLSFGWKPYDRDDNRLNTMMGSKINAFLNVNFFLRWMLTRELDLTFGPTLTHFSNGNTKIPNAGLNSAGIGAGLTYNFGRERAEIPQRTPAPEFRRHFSYDLVLFGSWCSKGVEVGDVLYASPDTYPVVGFNFSALYNFGYKFRAGLSLDGVYDGSANVYVPDRIAELGGGAPLEFARPTIDRQLALGLSGRAEFVMPYFTIGLGLGMNVLHKGGDLKAFYQTLTLKVGITRNAFAHIGYSLRDFHMPNFLMLGVGYRFNNKYPRHY